MNPEAATPITKTTTMSSVRKDPRTPKVSKPRPPPAYTPVVAARKKTALQVSSNGIKPHSNTSVGRLLTSDAAERKLSASLLSIKLFWGPELEKERRLRLSEKKRADHTEELLREQLQKGVNYMKKLTFLQGAYEELEDSATKKADMEEELRQSLEEQLKNLRADAAESASFSAIELKQKVRRRDNAVAELKAKVAEQADEISSLQQHIKNSPAEAAAKLRSEAEAMVQTAKSQMERQTAELNELRKQSAGFLEQKQKIASLSGQLKAKENDYASVKLTAKLVSMEDLHRQQLHQHDDAVRNLEAELSETREAAERSGREAQTEHDKLKRQVRDLSHELELKQSEIESEHAGQATRSRVIDRLHEDLARQKEVANEFEMQVSQLSAEKRVLTEQLAAQGVQYENTSGDLAASRQALKTAQLEVDRLKDNLAEVEEQLADRSTRLNEAQDAQAQVERLDEMCQALRQSLATKDKQAQESARKHADVVRALEERITNMNGNAARKEAELSQIRSELNQAKSYKLQCDTISATLGTREKEIESLKQRLERIKALEEDISTLQDTLLVKEATISELRQNYSGEASKLEQANKDLRVQLAVKAKEAESLKNTHERLHETEQKLRNAESTIENKSRQADELRSRLPEIESLRASVEELSEDLKRKDTEMVSLRDASAKAESRLQGELAVVRDLLGSKERELSYMSVQNTAEVSQLQSDLENLRNKLQSTRTQAREDKNNLTAKITSANRELEKLRAQMTEKDTQLQSAQRQYKDGLDSALKKHRQASSSVDEYRDQVKRLEQTVDQLRQDYDTKDLECETLRHESEGKDLQYAKTVRELKRQGSDTLAKLEELEHALTSSRDLQQQWKQELDAARQDVAVLDADRQNLLEEGQMQAEVMSQMTDKLTEQSEQQSELEEAVRVLQQEMLKKDSVITQLETEHRDLQEKIIFERTNALLGMVSEKDQRIAVLEMAGAKKHKKDIDELNRERENDLQALKEQFAKRAALLAVNQTQTSMDRSVSNREELLERLQVRETDAHRLRTYIDQLLAEVLRQSESISTAILTGLPRLQQDSNLDSSRIESMTDHDIASLLKSRNSDNANLEAYVDQLLARIVEHRPSILEVMSFTGR